MTLPESFIPRKLTALKKSKFRSKFRLTKQDRDYIAAKGLETIKEHSFQFINSRIAPAFPKNDGKQTPGGGIQSSSLSMQLPPAAGDVFKNGMELRRGGR